MKALRDLEPDFWRAPSAHNTQPWVLRYRDDGAEIGWDPARTLPAGDPTGRDLRLSLGAFVETCLIVCADAGVRARFRPSSQPQCVGYLVTAADRYVTPFTTRDVQERRSGRAGYVPGQLDAAVADDLDRLAAEEGATVRRLCSHSLIELLHDADHHLFATPPVAQELRTWLRVGRAAPDGLTGAALGLSGWESRGLHTVLAPHVYPMLRRLGLPALLARASRGTLDYDGEVLVLVAGPGERDEVTLGRLLMRLWLTLSTHSHTTHPLSQIIDADHTRHRLAHLLDIDDPARLLHVARVGLPATPPPRSARLR